MFLIKLISHHYFLSCLILFCSYVSISQSSKKISQGIELNIALGSKCAKDGSDVGFILEIKNLNSHDVQIPAEYRITSDPGNGVGNISFELIYLSNDSTNVKVWSSQCIFGSPKGYITLPSYESHLLKTDLEDYNFIRKGDYKIRFYTQHSVFFYQNLPELSTDWYFFTVQEHSKKYNFLKH